MTHRHVVLALGLLSLASCALGCSESPSAHRQAVVYGEDGRTEVFAHSNTTLRALAESAVAMKVDWGYVNDADPGDVRIDYTRTLGEAKTLCAGERFADQIEPGLCSGTLIDDRYLLTAGHCMDTPADCTDDAWVFGFRYAADGVLAPLTGDDVYGCARVLAYFDDGQVDHAIVELDRPVVGHAPAPVQIEPAGLAVGTPVALIGHPNGIPMKIDDGGEVTWSSSDATFLNATVDAFDGNSGSGVFDSAGRLVAVLVGGMNDYVDAGGCNVVDVIDPPPGDDGEDLTYVRPALDAFCATPGIESTLCMCDGPCVPSPPGDRCENAETLTPMSQVITDTLDGFAPTTTGSCGGAGRERAWTFTVTREVDFSARSQGFDSVLHLRDACDGVELECNDDIDRDTDRGSRIARRLAPGSYVLFLDAYDADAGAFTLTLEFADTPPDGGPPPADAATPTVDAGTPTVDAGGPAAMGGGCGCRAGGIGASAPAAWTLFAAVAFVWQRRRRRGYGAE